MTDLMECRLNGDPIASSDLLATLEALDGDEEAIVVLTASDGALLQAAGSTAEGFVLGHIAADGVELVTRNQSLATSTVRKALTEFVVEPSSWQGTLTWVDPSALTTKTAEGPTGSNRRAILVLVFFIVTYLPILLGATWAIDRVVFIPLCAQDGLEVTGIEQFSPDVTGNGQETTCLYADGNEATLADVVGGGRAMIISIVALVVRFGLPFLVTGLFLWLLPKPRAS